MTEEPESCQLSQKSRLKVFARKRVTFDCDVEVLERGSEYWQKIMSLFDDCVVELMQTLRQLADFHLIRLKPKSGFFFRGFGKAYGISGVRTGVICRM